MAKRVFLSFFGLFLSIFLLSLVSAEITIENLNHAYSLGDELNIKLSALEKNNVEGTMNLILNCDSYQLPFFVTFVKLKAGETKVFTIEPLKVSQTGTCKLKAELKKVNETFDSIETSEFQISDAINVTMYVSREHYAPGETIEISGDAQKINGDQFNGLGTINLDKDYSISVKGRFALGLKIDPQIKSGKHLIIATAKDDNGNIGKAEKEIYIDAIPTKIMIVLNKDKFMPNEDIYASIKLYDQAGDEMNESIMATLYDSWGSDILSKVTNGQMRYTFKPDATPGNWWVYAYASGIKEREFFYIEKSEKINISLENDTLKIQNIGNVKYQKPVEIMLSSEGKNNTASIQLNIPINKAVLYKLDGPTGNYSISVKGTDLEESFSAILTGKAISISDINAKDITKSLIVWIFIALIAGLSLLSRYKTNTKNIQVKVKHFED